MWSAIASLLRAWNMERELPVMPASGRLTTAAVSAGGIVCLGKGACAGCHHEPHGGRMAGASACLPVRGQSQPFVCLFHGLLSLFFVFLIPVCIIEAAAPRRKFRFIMRYIPFGFGRRLSEPTASLPWENPSLEETIPTQLSPPAPAVPPFSPLR